MSGPLVVITSRMNSYRLMGKALRFLDGVPLIRCVYDRCNDSTEYGVVVATDEHSPEIVALCKDHGMDVYCSTHDVDILSRLLEVGDHYEASHVIRVTGDNPLTCPKLMTAMVDLCKALNADYVSPMDYPKIPRGIRSEVIKMDHLRNVVEATCGYEADDISGKLRTAIDGHVALVDCGYDTRASFTIDTEEQMRYMQMLFQCSKLGHSIEELIEFEACHPSPETAETPTLAD